MADPVDAPGWLGVAAGLISGGALGAIVQALRKPSSQAEIIRVAQEAAAAVIEDLQDEVKRLRQQDVACQASLAEVREQLSVLRMAQGLAPYKFKAPVRGEEDAG